MQLDKGVESDVAWFRENDPTHSYRQICVKLLKHYGLYDTVGTRGTLTGDDAERAAEAWFTRHSKWIADQCKPDPHKLTKFSTLKEYWEAKQMEARWNPKMDAVTETHSPSASSTKCVELYRVRGPGSNGEIGVLTTTHEVEAFITGLASAAAKLIEDSPGDAEHQLTWILTNAMPIAFRLAGYKADQVVERHVLMCGSSAPAADDIVASA